MPPHDDRNNSESRLSTILGSLQKQSFDCNGVASSIEDASFAMRSSIFVRRGTWILFSLTFILVCVSVVAYLMRTETPSSTNPSADKEYVSYMGPIPGIAGSQTAMQWRRVGVGKWKLLHGVICEVGVSGSVNVSNDPNDVYASRVMGVAGARLIGPQLRDPIQNIDVLMFPTEIFANGTRLHPTTDSPIFAVGRFGKSTPIKLTQQELDIFHPDVYPQALTSTTLWKKAIRPIVDPDGAAEEFEFELVQKRSDLGITLQRVYGPHRGPLIYYSDFEVYRDGSSKLLNAFFASDTSVAFTMHDSNLERRTYTNPDPDRVPGYRCAYLESFPSFYVINGEKVEREKVYVEKRDGTIKSLELTEEEYSQLTRDLLRDTEKLKGTEVFRTKIAPAIRASVEAK